MLRTPGKALQVQAFDIAEAWLRTVITCWKRGLDYEVEQGSFVGHTRRQLPLLILEIASPSHRPFTPLLAEGFNPLTNDDAILTYAEQYILSPTIQPNEEYTYGARLCESIPRVIEILRHTKNTNQAVIEIACAADTFLSDPPCLRLLDWKVHDSKLDLVAYFRSWDVYAALTSNLGGIQILNELISTETKIAGGKLTVISSGAHVYDYVFEAIMALTSYYEIIE